MMNFFFTYLLTVIVPLLGVGISLLHSRIDKGKFFAKEYTDVMKGLCCLIVIYVHVKPERGNILQDAIGSFAYVAVTFFFVVSAYGMLAGMERKTNYLEHFWRNRLTSLLIPCLLVNILGYILEFLVKGQSDLVVLYTINSYVVVLLQWCLWFYIVERCRLKWFAEKKHMADWLLVAGVIISSLYLYLFVEAKVSAEAGWPFERMGLIWGVLLYRYFNTFIEWMNFSKTKKIIVLLLFGVLLGVAYLKFKTIYFWGAYLLKIVLALSLLLLLFTTTSNRSFGDKISNWLGEISYEVYLSHGIILGLANIILPENMSSGIYILTAVVVILALSTGIHALGKPIVKILRR